MLHSAEAVRGWTSIFLRLDYNSRIFSRVKFAGGMADGGAGGFPGGPSGKEPACQCSRHKRCSFNPSIGKIPWRRAWQPTPVFLPENLHEQRSLAGYSPWYTFGIWEKEWRIIWLKLWLLGSWNRNYLAVKHSSFCIFFGHRQGCFVVGTVFYTFIKI